MSIIPKQYEKLSAELYADSITPIEALRLLRETGGRCFMFESAPDGDSWGRYTFLGVNPELTVRGTAAGISVTNADGNETVMRGNQHSLLRELIGSYVSPQDYSLPPFTGGFVGYVSYEYLTCVETALKLSAPDDVGYDLFELMLFTKIIAFDNFRQKITIIVNIPAGCTEAERNNAAAEIDALTALLQSSRPAAAAPAAIAPGEFISSMTRGEFCDAVTKVKRHIFEGDIFQAVPSVRFSASYGDDLFDAYRELRTVNPSAYMFYLRMGSLTLAGASPETLVSLVHGTATTFPLAGTCARTQDEDETAGFIAELLSDEKELAEHDMLVDLGRNDLGKVCDFGTVRVAEYRTVKKMSHVCHIASRVTGRVNERYSALDVLAAALPAGTLSGAPKKRACEIIDSVEPSRRGAYGGAIGYIDFAGNMDFCIGIRMAVLKNRRVYVQAGAGIVADSVPEHEYEECLRKAKAMMSVLGGAK